MTLNLGSSKTLLFARDNGATITTDTLNVVSIVENPIRRLIVVFIAELSKPVILYKGTAYDNLGNYTRLELRNKLLEVINAEFVQP